MTFQQLFFPNKPFLFKKKINDPKFGLMWFNKESGDYPSYYQCQITFEPNNSVVDVFFDSKKEGINESQKLFFKKIETEYINIIENNNNEITAIFKKQENNTIDLVDFKNECRLNAIFIPNNPIETLKFRLRYEYNKNPLKGLVIEFEHWKLKSRK